LRPKVQRFLSYFLITINSNSNIRSKFELTYEFESHTSKSQNKSNKPLSWPGKRLLVVEEEQKKKIVGCCSLLDQRKKH
jgi:hypothetical protein